jgi:NADPH2:quinone reductase
VPQGIRISTHGGPEVLEWGPIDVAAPGPGEVCVRHTAIGVNFIDVYDRTGLYPQHLPGSLGREAAGVVVSAGQGVRGFAAGDRVAYVVSVPGSYVEVRNVPAHRLVKLPETITDAQAAAVLMKGLTAEYLLRRTYRVRRKDCIVIHAAAGGVGLIAVQWARALGARVIAVVGSEAKALLVREHGAHEVIDTSREDLVTRVRDITRGQGVPVVYDSIGKDTFFASLDCLRPRGLMVTYGNASGPVAPFSPLELSQRGSLYVTRPTLYSYIGKPAELARAAGELFAIVASGAVQIRIGQTYALREAAQAHRDLEGRRTIGSTVLVP